jgi:catechol 2,3-dioxygenase-like lactoylglutathione lyase family enzyme
MNTPLRAFRPHISIDVRNLPSSVAFYTNLFGRSPVKVRPGYAKFSLESPALNFSINEREHEDGGSLSHLGFEVLSTQEVLDANERLRSAGLSIREEMETTCCYAKQDKIWITDPDGNSWEIFTVTESDSVNANSASQTCCVPAIVQVSEACCVRAPEYVGEACC